MLFKIAGLLLIAWLCGVVGLYQAGEIVHVLLLAGMLLMLMAFLKAREAAMNAARREPPAKS